MLAKIGWRSPSGVNTGQKASRRLADVLAAQDRRERLAQRRLPVSARPQAVIAAQHEQARPLADSLQEHFLLLRTKVGAVQVAEDEDIELVGRLLVGGDGRQLEPLHVRPLEENVGARLHQGAELQVGVLRQHVFDQGPVFRPQRPLQVQQANPRLDDHGAARTLIVFHDLLLRKRRHANGVGVPALGLRAELEDDLLRPGALAERQLLLPNLPAVLLQDDVDHASGQPNAFDRGGDAGEVLQQQAVGAIDADHLDVAAGEIVVETCADADGMDGHAQPGGRLDRVPHAVVHAVGQEDDRGRFGLWRLGRPRLQRPHKQRRFSRRAQARQRLDAFQRPSLLGKLDQVQIEVPLELAAPLLQLRPSPG